MIYNIQALRALAALLVVGVHLDKVLAPAGATPADVLFGEVGVDLFFVISGFVMVFTMARRPMTAGSFLLNRIIRVVPLYWLLTLALFVTALAAPALLNATRAAPIDLLRSLLFVPFVKANGLVQPLLFVGWTLNYEMFFYGLFGLMIWLGRGRLGRVVAMAVAVLAGLVLLGLVFRPSGVLGGFYTNPIVIEFGFGMLLGVAHLRGYGVGRWTATALLLIGLGLLLGGVLRPFGPRALYGGVPGAVVLFAALSLEARGWALRARPVQLVGAASYALYLVHPFAVQACARLGARIASPAAAVALATLAVALAVAIGIIVHLTVERRLTAWLRGLIGHRPAVVETVAAGEIMSSAPLERDKSLACR